MKVAFSDPDQCASGVPNKTTDEPEIPDHSSSSVRDDE